MINNDNNTYLGIINYASSSCDIIVVVTVFIGYRSLFGLDFLVTTSLVFMYTPKYSFCASIHSDCISASLAITSFIAGTSSSWLHFS